MFVVNYSITLRLISSLYGHHMTFSFLLYYLCTCIVSTCILIQLLAATQNKSLILYFSGVVNLKSKGIEIVSQENLCAMKVALET